MKKGTQLDVLLVVSTNFTSTYAVGVRARLCLPWPVGHDRALLARCGTDPVNDYGVVLDLQLVDRLLSIADD